MNGISLYYTRKICCFFADSREAQLDVQGRHCIESKPVIDDKVLRSQIKCMPLVNIKYNGEAEPVYFPLYDEIEQKHFHIFFC